MQPQMENFFQKMIFSFSQFLGNTDAILKQYLNAKSETSQALQDDQHSDQVKKVEEKKKSVHSDQVEKVEENKKSLVSQGQNQLNEAKAKKPRSSFIYFCQHVRQKNQEKLKKMTLLEQNVLIGAAWRTLGEDKKQNFRELAKKDKKRYKKEDAILRQKNSHFNNLSVEKKIPIVKPKITPQIGKEKSEKQKQQNNAENEKKQNQNLEIPNVDVNKSTNSLKTRAQRKREIDQLKIQQENKIQNDQKILQVKDQIENVVKKSDEIQEISKKQSEEIQTTDFFDTFKRITVDQKQDISLSAGSQEENDKNTIDKESSISQKILGFLKNQTIETVNSSEYAKNPSLDIDESPEYDVIDKRKLMRKKLKQN